MIDLSPLGQEKGFHVEQIDDGGNKRGLKTVLAKAAGEGDMDSLRRHLDAGDDLETRLPGFTPLRLAVIYGQAVAASELIIRGRTSTLLILRDRARCRSQP